MRIRHLGLLAGFSGALAAACAPRPGAAELLVLNGLVYTADTARWTAEALAVRSGRVVYVGSRDGAMAYRGASTRVEDLAGAIVVPGITDAHAHLVNLGSRGIDLVGTATYDEVIARVAARARDVPKGEWVLGRGWDQNDWPEKALPTHDRLTAAVPDHPVYLTRVDGHAGLANAAAMRRAAVARGVRDPDGGRVERNRNGDPTGVFIDNAQRLVRAAIPPPSRDQVKRAILDAQAEMHRWGLTAVHDAGSSRVAIGVYQELGRSGQLTARVYAMLSDDPELLDEWLRRGPAIGLYDGKLWVRSIKGYMDGALGSRGAALLAPYGDDPATSGLLVSTPEHIRELADKALARGFQLGVHAIGDRGNRLVLDSRFRCSGSGFDRLLS